MNMRGTAPHGGNVDELAREYGVVPDSILDFSANINPRGLPQEARLHLQRAASNMGLLARYPDPNYRQLREALALKYQIPVESLVIGGGASALIISAMQALCPSRCLIPVPAFSEYMRASAACGIEAGAIPLGPDGGFRLDSAAFAQALKTGKFDCAILNNPHNPSGALLGYNEMLCLLERARAAGAATIVDEAFADYAPAASVIQHAARNPNVIVIRSLTKFYGCAGLRAGFLAAAPETAARAAASIPAWPVGILAAIAFEWAAKDNDYASITLQENATERESLSASLKRLGAGVFPSSANFLLLRLKDTWPCGAETRDFLLRRHHIAVRDCSSYAGLAPERYIRVAVRTAEDNRRLLQGLEELWNSTLPHH